MRQTQAAPEGYSRGCRTTVRSLGGVVSTGAKATHASGAPVAALCLWRCDPPRAALLCHV